MRSPSSWEPFVEPWHTTALRTGAIALGIGLAVGLYRQRPVLMPEVALVALWFTLGGHFLEILFRNRLRQRLSRAATVQALARLAWWFVGGAVLSVGALTTWATLSGRDAVQVRWWLGGLGLVAAELLVHLVLLMRGQASFYDGRG